MSMGRHILSQGVCVGIIKGCKGCKGGRGVSINHPFGTKVEPEQTLVLELVLSGTILVP